ncbi:MAG: hypothetical protein LBS89_07100, partial [Zoogloeaceae bacterium]|nr:hypothetical protein [Zoogloeaceae bacterium]
MKLRFFALGLLSLLMLAACHDESGEKAATNESQAAPPPAFDVSAVSLQDIMVSEVDLAADELWDSVSEEWDKDGYRKNHPVTDEDWQKLRHYAVILLESSNSLLIPGRPVAVPGKQLEDADVAGVLGVEGVEKVLRENRAGFDAFALTLHEVAKDILVAVDAKNTEALVETGARLDAVCESCHLQYWYPDAQKPPS